MQKKIWGMTVAAFLVIVSSAQAQTTFGVCGYGKKTVDYANCAGPASLQETTVTGDVHIAGPIKAFQSTIGSMDIAGMAELDASTVQGKASVAGMLKAHKSILKVVQVAGGADLKKTTIKGDAKIAGSLLAVDSRFERNVDVYSDSIRLKSSEVKGDLLVKSKHEKPVVTLVCGSHVGGSITFSDVAGVVKVSPNSSVSGKINNGITEVVKNNCDEKME
jgi:hypothetical protein